MNKIVSLASLVVFVMMPFFISCEKNEAGPPEENSGNEEIILDNGFIGLVIDTRDIAKKGYSPETANISFSGAYSQFSEEISIDPYTNVGTLTIDLDDIDDNTEKTLSEGVNITITVLDKEETILAELTDNVKIDHSNNPVIIITEMPKKFPELNISENIPYLIQAITDDEDANNRLFAIRIDNNFEPGLDAITLQNFDNKRMSHFSFYFEQISDTVFHIKMNLNDVSYYLQMSGPGNFYSYYITDKSAADFDHFKYVVKRDENGLVKIKPLSGNPLGKRITSYDTQVSYASSPDEYLPVRMVAANISWNVQDRGTVFNPPILPPAQLDFAFKSILKNCSAATLTETVGKSESQTRSYTVGTEESIELYSSHQGSVDVTAGVETETQLFGQSATASVEVSVGYTYTTSTANTTTNTWSETVEETVEVSRTRDVEIPPYTAVEVFDAIQTLNNVKMPFVQRLRVKGTYDNGVSLTGEEIQSQLLENQFGGAVSSVQDDFVEISIKGTAVINKFFEVESKVNELPNECDN